MLCSKSRPDGVQKVVLPPPHAALAAVLAGAPEAAGTRHLLHVGALPRAGFSSFDACTLRTGGCMLQAWQQFTLVPASYEHSASGCWLLVILPGTAGRLASSPLYVGIQAVGGWTLCSKF